jgi:hypothetical protein
MQKVSINMGEVVKGMDVAMNAMDLEKVHAGLKLEMAGLIIGADIGSHG